MFCMSIFKCVKVFNLFRRTGERLDVRRDYVMLKVDDLAKLESLSDVSEVITDNFVDFL